MLSCEKRGSRGLNKLGAASLWSGVQLPGSGEPTARLAGRGGCGPPGDVLNILTELRPRTANRWLVAWSQGRVADAGNRNKNYKTLINMLI